MVPGPNNRNRRPEWPLPINMDCWSNAHLSQLLDLTEKYDQNWIQISKRINFFGEIDCRDQFLRLQARWVYDEWTPAEEVFLARLAQASADPNWFECSILLKSRSPEECRKQWAKRQEEFDVNRPWKHNEQVLIFRLILRFGFLWKKIAEQVPGRTSNKIKNLFYSEMARIKSSKLQGFLKKMLCHHTCTNYSKRLQIRVSGPDFNFKSKEILISD